MKRASACYKLGSMYCKGVDITKDLVQAANLFKRAAEMGNSAAQHDLGFMYAAGQGGIPKDVVEGWAWVDLAGKANPYFAHSSETIATLPEFDANTALRAKQRSKVLAAEVAARKTRQ